MTATFLEKFFIPETKNTFPNLFKYRTLLERSFTRFIGDSSLNFSKLILLCNSNPNIRKAIISPVNPAPIERTANTTSAMPSGR